MTFELSPQHLQVRDNARGVAQMLAPQASEIERTRQVPAAITRELAALAGDDALASVVVVEEVSVASPAAALASFGDGRAGALNVSGLRGAQALQASPRTQLLLAAAALGIGRAAMAASLEALRQGPTDPGDVERPQWVVADVATELDAARLLVYKAGASGTEADIAMARLMAGGAAARAVDAAVRIVGVDAVTDGSVVERLTRDIRALSVLLGTEETQRAVAADELLPQ